MPNIGKPSGGCHACRRMKVKCDQRRPGCKRCERAGRICPGYREDPSLFVSMNQSSENKALNPRPRRRQRGTSSHSQSPRPDPSGKGKSPVRQGSFQSIGSAAEGSAYGTTSPDFSRQPSAQQSPPDPSTNLGPVMSTNWEDTAICYYFSEYIIYPSESGELAGYLDFLPDLVNECAHVGHLTEALKSVSLSLMGNRSSMDQLRVEGRRSYGKALSQVNAALSDQNTAIEDSTLATLLLLGHYELISGDKPDSSLWMSHGAGQAAVIALRGPAQFNTERGRGLFRVAQSALQIRDVFQKSSGSFAAPILEDLPDEVFRHALSKQFHEFSRRISKARSAVADLMAECAPATATGGTSTTARAEREFEAARHMPTEWHARLLAVVQQQAELLADMDVLNEWGFGDWRYWVAPGLVPPPPAAPDPEDFAAGLLPGGLDPQRPPRVPRTSLPSYVYVFPGLQSAGAWASFWASRLLLIEGVAASADVLRRAGYAHALPGDLDGDALAAQTERGVEDVCAAVPFLLGELHRDGTLRLGGHGKSIGAYYALWPLHVLGSVRGLASERLDWVLERMSAVGHVFGIRQAHILRDWRTRNPRRLPSGMGAPPPPAGGGGGVGGSSGTYQPAAGAGGGGAAFRTFAGPEGASLSGAPSDLALSMEPVPGAGMLGGADGLPMLAEDAEAALAQSQAQHLAGAGLGPEDWYDGSGWQSFI